MINRKSKILLYGSVNEVMVLRSGNILVPHYGFRKLAELNTLVIDCRLL